MGASLLALAGDAVYNGQRVVVYREQVPSHRFSHPLLLSIKKRAWGRSPSPQKVRGV
ncbi:conserved hypothetical protein [Pseudomonas brassicacearum]